jgi:hypothetical protein
MDSRVGPFRSFAPVRLVGLDEAPTVNPYQPVCIEKSSGCVPHVRSTKHVPSGRGRVEDGRQRFLGPTVPAEGVAPHQSRIFTMRWPVIVVKQMRMDPPDGGPHYYPHPVTRLS